MVVKVEVAIGNDEMLHEHDGQRFRFFGRRRRRRWFTGREIRKVKLAVGAANDVRCRMGQPYFAKGPRPAEKRRELKIDVELIETGEGFAVGLGERQSSDRQREGVRIQFDLPDRGLPLSQRREPLDELRFDNGWQDKKASNRVNQKEQ